MELTKKIGFMQGRLSPLVEGKIQAFPWDTWREEFAVAQTLGLKVMEWTLDQDRLHQNPLMTSDGHIEIRRLCQTHSICIPSLTGDCFMQAPFWKVSEHEAATRKEDFIAIARACSRIGIDNIVVPLVDGGRLENEQQEAALLAFMLAHREMFKKMGLRIVFESDFGPIELARFISRLPEDTFGVNYDIGNSAALGYKPSEEFECYGERIVNVHLKDRSLGGPSVPLGAGDADFSAVFRLLSELAYSGYIIMQTARATDDNHAGALSKYIAQIDTWAEGL
ncbi:TIM barrel protein [Rhodobacterales bacterium LSUCC0387]|nr:TIM barrel protein [Rhodobacterales bacterium LSUCC0387]